MNIINFFRAIWKMAGEDEHQVDAIVMLPDCDKGYKGNCCCNCKHQRMIRICDCGKCSLIKGWICVVHINNDYTCKYMERLHGSCELHKRRAI